MTNTTIYIDKNQAPTFECLLEYLYNNEYYTMIKPNEYDSIIYYSLDDKIYMKTDLFSGVSIHCLEMINIINENEYMENKNPLYFYTDLWNSHIDEDDFIKNKNKVEININMIDKLSYDKFIKLLVYLKSWLGEYGDEILKFNTLGDKWKIEMRVDTPYTNKIVKQNSF